MKILPFALASLLFATPAFAVDCSTTTEEAIQQAIKAEPSKLVKMLEGKELVSFVSHLTHNGYLIGVIAQVDRIYIVDAGKLPGYTSDNVWLFFVQDGCLISAIPAWKPVIEGLLK